MEGPKFSPKSEKQKKKTRRVGVVQGNMSTGIYGNILRVYNYNVRSIAGLIVIKLTFVFKGGGGVLGVLHIKFCKKIVQNPAILEDFMSSWAYM